MKKALLLLTAALWALLSCSDPDTYTVTPELLNNAVKFVTTDQDLGADGYQTLTIEAELMKDTKESKRDVTFTTSAGTFVEEGKTTVMVKAVPVFKDNEIKLIASASLKSSTKPETAVIKAKAGELTAQKSLTVTFKSAPPTSVSLSASAFTIKASFGGEITLTAKLTRTLGIPTVGTNVEFIVTKPGSSTSIPSVVYRSKNQSSDDTGTTSATFAISDTTFLGKATATVKVKDSTLQDTVNIFITK
ncbi:hypothetical protein [Spirosoma fluminis]